MQIRITDIEFWNRDANDMKRRHERKMYPPRVVMTISIRNPELTHTLPIKFEGCADNSQLDIDLTIPFGKKKLDPSYSL